ncbi:MAG TPA: hypothetical protein VHP99_04780 [Pyrinomonadaceae bacterium]|nr:hypothetical protein [Pyrinomonadaceae bacterium]
MDDQLISKTVSRNLKFLSARKHDSSFLEKTRPYQRTVRCGFLLALAFFAFAASAAAQPTMSRGEQLLPISYNECIRRAEQAYLAEGWVNIGKGGAFVNAFKENNGAYITCNVAPENKTWVNIFVASNSGDGGVPGAERVKLQRRMSDPSGSSGNNLNSFAGEWNASVQNGYSFKMSLRQDGNRVTGTHDDNRTIIEGVVDGRTLRFRYIYKDNSTRGAGTLVLSDDGRSLSGFYSHTDDPNNGSNGSWKATRQ